MSSTQQEQSHADNALSVPPHKDSPLPEEVGGSPMFWYDRWWNLGLRFAIPLAAVTIVLLGIAVHYYGGFYEHAIARSRASSDPAESLPVMFELPEFSLTERFGQPVTLDKLKGKVWIADFIFTTCPGPCPMMTRRMAALQSNMAAEAGVRFLTITVDPKMDTPDRLRRYADQFRAPKDRWLFLTGDREAIFKLSTQGFKLAAIVDNEAAAPSDHPILHSTKFVLVDRQARIRGYYDGTSEEDVKRVEADARRLAAEGAD